MKKTFLFTLSVLLMGEGFAGTTTCSSPDQRLFYSESIQDVGIQPPEPLKTAIVLKLDRKLLIRKNVVDPKSGTPKQDIERAQIEVLQTLNIDSQSIEKSGTAETIDHDLRKVAIQRDGADLYQGIIHCRKYTALVP